MVQCFLRQVLVAEPDIAMQRRPKVFAAVEAMGAQDLCDASIEAFGHAVGLRRFGLGQTVIDAQALAQEVEFVLARGLLGAAWVLTVGKALIDAGAREITLGASVDVVAPRVARTAANAFVR